MILIGECVHTRQKPGTFAFASSKRRPRRCRTGRRHLTAAATDGDKCEKRFTPAAVKPGCDTRNSLRIHFPTKRARNTRPGPHVGVIDTANCQTSKRPTASPPTKTHTIASKLPLDLTRMFPLLTKAAQHARASRAVQYETKGGCPTAINDYRMSSLRYTQPTTVLKRRGRGPLVCPAQNLPYPREALFVHQVSGCRWVRGQPAPRPERLPTPGEKRCSPGPKTGGQRSK